MGRFGELVVIMDLAKGYLCAAQDTQRDIMLDMAGL
jgi:hypothetical protein